MINTRILISLLIILSVSACSQVEAFLPDFDLLASTPTSNISKPPLETTDLTSSPTTVIQPTASQQPTITFTPKPTRTPRPTSTPSATLPPIIRIDPENIPDYVNPLTGLTALNPQVLERRPIAVKIPNYPHSIYPQSGLSSADHIYEYHLEQGLTRFIAIFYGNDSSRVGPIRSGRIFDAHIIQMYNAIFVFNYAYHEEGNESLDVYGYLEETLNDDLFVVDPGDCTFFMCRDTSINSYNNLFGSTYGITQLIDQRGQENGRQALGSNYFSTLGGRSRSQATIIHVNYSYANYAYWLYQKNTQRYSRYQGNQDLVNGNQPEYILLTDANNDLPIEADNVVVLFVPHEYRYKSSTDLSEVFDIQLVEKGDAYVFRNGSAFQATWERKDTNRPISILNMDGSYFHLKPGVTFFQILHTDSSFLQDGDIWTFTFERPEEE